MLTRDELIELGKKIVAVEVIPANLPLICFLAGKLKWEIPQRKLISLKK